MPSGATDGGKVKVIDTPQSGRGDYQLSAQRRIVVIGAVTYHKRKANPARSPAVFNNSRRTEDLGYGETRRPEAGFVAEGGRPPE